MLSRGGQNPDQGGLGHICRIEVEPGAADAYTTIGGNENNCVKRTARTLQDNDLRGFLEN